MRDQLSSQLTLIFKFLFPALYLTGMGGGAIAMLASGDSEAYFYILMAVVGGLAFWAFCIPLKQVYAKEDGLLVSNFFREEHVPYANITEVKELRWVNIRPIVLTLRQPCGFGHKIMFMPYWMAWMMFWNKHPAAEFLEEKVGR